MGRVVEGEEGPLTPASWDLDFEPGRYAVEVVSSDCFYFNYLVAGKLDVPYQIHAIRPSLRFGEVSSAPFFGKGGWGDVRGNRFDFDTDGSPIRFETYAQTEFPNTQPVPPELGSWVNFHPVPPHIRARIPGDQEFYIRNAGELTLGNTRATVSKMDDRDTELLILAEDGADRDFNDLVVRVRKLS